MFGSDPGWHVTERWEGGKEGGREGGREEEGRETHTIISLARLYQRSVCCCCCVVVGVGAGGVSEVACACTGSLA